MKALVGAFNQEKALVGAFSVIVNTGCGTDGSFYSTSRCTLLPPPPQSRQVTATKLSTVSTPGTLIDLLLDFGLAAAAWLLLTNKKMSQREL